MNRLEPGRYSHRTEFILVLEKNYLNTLGSSSIQSACWNGAYLLETSQRSEGVQCVLLWLIDTKLQADQRSAMAPEIVLLSLCYLQN